MPSSPADPDATHSRRSRVRQKFETARDARQRRRRLVSYGLFIGSLMLVVHAMFGENGYLATVRAERAHAEVTAQVDQVRQENRDLEYRIERLKHDPTALEEAAKELDMIRPGETLIILKDRSPGTPQNR